MSREWAIIRIQGDGAELSPDRVIPQHVWALITGLTALLCEAVALGVIRGPSVARCGIK